MRKSKMKRLKKLEYAMTHDCDVQVLIPINYDYCNGRRKATEWKWLTIHDVRYLRIVFTRNWWLRVVPKKGIAYCDVVETR